MLDTNPYKQPEVFEEEPTIEIVKDFDNYFKKLVQSAIDTKKKNGEKFRHKVVKIHALPYIAFDLEGTDNIDNSLQLIFYSAVRTGFGSGQATIENIMPML